MSDTKAMFVYYCNECGMITQDVRKQIEKYGEVPEAVKCRKCGQMADRPF